MPPDIDWTSSWYSFMASYPTALLELFELGLWQERCGDEWLHRDTGTMEGVIDFSTSAPIFSNDDERSRAEQLFLSLLAHFSAPDISHEHVELLKAVSGKTPQAIPGSLQIPDTEAHRVLSGPQHVARLNALAILDMFDVGVRHLIEGQNIDRPTNAITLTQEYHDRFGDFKTVFESTDQPHTYRIESVEDRLPVLRRPMQPITRTLFLSVARILRMSGAGEYCDSVLRDMDDPEILSDGTTNLGALVSLRLGGWWNGVVA
ncbi:hypothetical protein CMQ_18 [Grosmannia clavigera kw1407]|uniref:HNH nuclease domain-containing protein n=1 Tax=Grosmannia clavigera (strain kw1407 / UAMH 11150) TaxID=655863 RepID=F0XQP2_GROCL|nr:uncharacterized protein CMQ_18 [Grosmannia clavigera kw1407]EFW99700.1 hypothetical protein CMQ_18 [Grosmannia clavigera kw1407]